MMPSPPLVIFTTLFCTLFVAMAVGIIVHLCNKFNAPEPLLLAFPLAIVFFGFIILFCVTFDSSVQPESKPAAVPDKLK